MMTSLGGGDFELAVRQQPKYACVAIGKGKERKPIDPPPIVQLLVNPRKDPAKTYLQNPYLILTARLIRKGDEDTDEQQQSGLKESDLAGTLVSSLYSLKDTDNSQGGFFVFGDLSVRRVGTYRLAFILYELKLAEKECWLLARTVSDPFVVYATKTFPGLAESTFLTRSFSDQGVRLRLRKDSRTVSTKKRSIGVATQADQIRASQAIHGYLPHDGNHDLSPNGHSPHHMRRLSALQDAAMASGQLDRSRGSLGSQGSYYGDSPQLRGGEYGSAGSAYGYSPYDDKPAHKRARMDGGGGGGDDGSGAYDGDYHAYAGPRTVPDPLGSIYPPAALTTTGSYAAMPAQPAMVAVGGHGPAGMLPRLDTTQLPPHSAAAAGGPGSAASSAFSPGSRVRSPGSAYPYPPVQAAALPPSSSAAAAMFAPSPTATLPYHHPHAAAVAHHHHHQQQQQLSHQHHPHHHQGSGLGIALPGLELEGVDKHAH